MSEENKIELASSDQLSKLIETNEEANCLLRELLETQKAVREKQRKFWLLAIVNVVILILWVAWFGTKYGF